jgi:hypothetical protein
MRAIDAMKSERGEFSLTGLLVAISIFGFVLGATYTAFDVFNRSSRDTQLRNEASDRARNTSDLMARQMRNLATPTKLQPNAVVVAGPHDLIFETVAQTGLPPAGNLQNVEFVRYCLSTATRTLYTMNLPPASITSSTVVPTGGGCPGAGWSNVKAVAEQVVNVYGAQSRPVFAYDSSVNNEIRRVRADLYIDTDPGTGPAEQQVTTGVELRNQDRAPIARFPAPTLAGSHVALLDGSTSTDPDNDPLTYCWYDLAVPATTKVGDCGPQSIGASAVLRYYAEDATVTHRVYLVVTDPSGLESQSETRQFQIP